MRIIVPIATRARPMRLAGALHSLGILQSGKHEVSYIARVDLDDIATLTISPVLNETFGVEIVRKPRPVSLGQAWNELVENRDWDVAVVIADKHLCLTQNWDDIVATAFGPKHRLALARWTLLRAPEETLLIMSRKWYDVTRQIFPEWFPFWFSERWVFEVHQLAFGVGIPMIADLIMHEPTMKTQGLRDLEFWFDFFAKSRNLRIWEANAIAKAYNAKIGDIGAVLDKMRGGDEWQKPRIPLYYESRGEATAEPTMEYLVAKKRAQDWLDSNRLVTMEAQGAA